MIYFKVIKDNKVIDAGCTFLKWSGRTKRLYACNPDEGQFVQSYKEGSIYKASWMKPAPVEAGQYEEAEVSEISRVEYDEIIALLDDGETPEITPDVLPPVIHHDEPEDNAEKPLTVAEMRTLIVSQQEQIEMLTECILEMSNIVYGGDEV